MIQNKHLFKNIFINILIIFLVSLITVSIVNSKTQEGFSINDINKVVRQIDDVADLTKNIPNQISSIDNKLLGKVNELGSQLSNNLNNNLQNVGKSIENNAFDKLKNLGDQIEKNTVDKLTKIGGEIEKNTVDKIEKLGKEIEKNTLDFFTNKLKSIFTQLGDMFNKGLIKPINDLFMGIGNIFVQIFGILQEIGNKIVQLPNCVFTYAMQSTIDAINYTYSIIIPSAIRYPLSIIYKYTLGLVIEFIANITGYNASVNKCYGFNVNSEISKINSNLKDIDSSFKDNFGDINFSKIKI
jgi:hypothetical protein